MCTQSTTRTILGEDVAPHDRRFAHVGRTCWAKQRSIKNMTVVMGASRTPHHPHWWYFWACVCKYFESEQRTESAIIISLKDPLSGIYTTPRVLGKEILWISSKGNIYMRRKITLYRLFIPYAYQAGKGKLKASPLYYKFFLLIRIWTDPQDALQNNTYFASTLRI